MFYLDKCNIMDSDGKEGKPEVKRHVNQSLPPPAPRRSASLKGRGFAFAYCSKQKVIFESIFALLLKRINKSSIIASLSIAKTIF